MGLLKFGVFAITEGLVMNVGSEIRARSLSTGRLTTDDRVPPRCSWSLSVSLFVLSTKENFGRRPEVGTKSVLVTGLDVGVFGVVRWSGDEGWRCVRAKRLERRDQGERGGI